MQQQCCVSGRITKDITSDDIDQGGFLSVYEAVASVAQNTGQTVMDQLGGGGNRSDIDLLNPNFCERYTYSLQKYD